jgi:hypothetical protein
MSGLLNKAKNMMGGSNNDSEYDQNSSGKHSPFDTSNIHEY